jgi:hypothetical protein
MMNSNNTSFVNKEQYGKKVKKKPKPKSKKSKK